MDLDWIGLSVTGIIAGRSLLLCIESERELFLCCVVRTWKLDLEELVGEVCLVSSRGRAFAFH